LPACWGKPFYGFPWEFWGRCAFWSCRAGFVWGAGRAIGVLFEEPQNSRHIDGAGAHVLVLLRGVCMERGTSYRRFGSKSPKTPGFSWYTDGAGSCFGLVARGLYGARSFTASNLRVSFNLCFAAVKLHAQNAQHFGPADGRDGGG
jgi:hypothetical protein